jgi:hypothetical protein
MKWLILMAFLPAVVGAETNQPAPAVVTTNTLIIGIRWKLRYLAVPKVDFRDADPREVIAYLQEQSGKLAADKQPINVAWLIPPEEKLPRVSMNLTDIPLEEAFKYTVTAARLRYRVETHAVVIYRPEPPAAGNNVPAR